MKQSTPSMVTAHIFFVDAVGYSTLNSDQQTVVFRQLQEFVGDCSAVIDASAQDKLVRSPSGDGMALVFFDHCSSPLRCACELMDRIERRAPSKHEWEFTPAKSRAWSISMASHRLAAMASTPRSA